MVFLSFLNLGLALLFYIFEVNQITAVGWASAGGITLAFLFNYLSKTRPPIEVLLAIIATNVVVLLLCYSYILIWTSESLSLFMIALAIGALFCTFLATVHFFTYRYRIYSVVGYMATCATLVTSLPLVSYFWTMAAA